MPWGVWDRQFRNREEAGRRLAERLTAYRGRPDVIVLGLARGGIPIGYQIARALSLPLDVFIVRKLGVPGREELAMGAIATAGVRVLNEDILAALAIRPETVERVTHVEERELERREASYRGGRPPLDPRGRTVILVDDGIATGASMWSAVQALTQLHAAAIHVAVPVAPIETKQQFEKRVDEFLCLRTPSPFGGVGAWYEDFSQTSDEEARRLLSEREFLT